MMGIWGGRGLGASWSLILVVLCSEIIECGDGGFTAFLVVDGWVVLVQKFSQSLPLSRMKFMILQGDDD